MKKFKVALFIGRFQPFHNGHLYGLQKCLELAERVIIGIGSSQESGTENNPWDYATRKRMIESLPAQAGLTGISQKVTVVAIPDMFNDEKWGKLILDVIAKDGSQITEVVGVGNNDWTNRILHEIGVAVHETGLYNRDELEGIKIRTLMRNKDQSWKLRVPKEVVKCLEQDEK